MRLRVDLGKKILFGFIASLLLVAVHAAIITFDLRKVDAKLHIVEVADDLTNRILEIRRAEKNFLLYRDPKNLDETLSYLDEAAALLKSLGDEHGSFSQLERHLSSYREETGRLKAVSTPGLDKTRFDEQAERLRGTGRLLLEESSRVSQDERSQVRVMIRNAWRLLLTALAISLAVGIFISRLIARRIVMPLGVLERSTERILGGDFSPIQGIRRTDEIGSLVEAFNHMIRELQEKQAQLVQSAKLASLGTLTSGVAHELNNPLSNISTSAEILAEETFPPDLEFYKKYLSRIVSETTRARRIIGDLLEFSRETDATPESTPIPELFAHALRLIEHSLKLSKVKVSIELPPDLPMVRIHHAQATQVFLNLFLNAVQAMPGGGDLRLSARPIDGGNRVEIRVQDTGAGIAPENLPRIFDPFFTTKAPGEGTGLGLSVSYGIVKHFGGTIRALSVHGQSTTMVVTLPGVPRA